MTRYLYTGIQTAIALPAEKEGDPPVEVALVPYEEAELPAELPYVQRLLTKGLLSPVEPIDPPEPAKSTKRKEPQA